jgi:hypothetical protein
MRKGPADWKDVPVVLDAAKRRGGEAERRGAGETERGVTPTVEAGTGGESELEVRGWESMRRRIGEAGIGRGVQMAT